MIKELITLNGFRIFRSYLEKSSKYDFYYLEHPIYSHYNNGPCEVSILIYNIADIKPENLSRDWFLKELNSNLHLYKSFQIKDVKFSINESIIDQLVVNFKQYLNLRAFQ